LELDEVRSRIVSGLADPQRPTTAQAEQYGVSVAACCALARVFTRAGYDVAIDDVLEPTAFDRFWQPELEHLSWQLVVVLPSLERTLARSAAREKRVLEHQIRRQHAACSSWPADRRIDTTDLPVEDALRRLEATLS
jgi:chloramphenicol 3-O-phosphotransferase